MERTAFSRLLSDLAERGFIAKETRKGRTWLTICNYADYVVMEPVGGAVFAKDEQRERAEVEFREEKETKETKEKKIKKRKRRLLTKTRKKRNLSKRRTKNYVILSIINWK